MTKIDKLYVNYHGRNVGTLSFDPNGQLCVFEYDMEWRVDGFSISPLELPLKEGTFLAKPMPFNGNFGIFEDSLPDGYGRYLLMKALKKEGIQESNLSALDRLSIVGEEGMGALTYVPINRIVTGTETDDFDMLQKKALGFMVLKSDDGKWRWIDIKGGQPAGHPPQRHDPSLQNQSIRKLKCALVLAPGFSLSYNLLH